MGKKRRPKAKAKSAASGGKTDGAKATPPSSSTKSESGGAGPPSQVELTWPEDKEAQEQLLTAIKLRTLAPFLFGQKTLSLEAKLCAVEANLLPRDEGVWPAFFEESQWRTAVLVVQVVLTSSHLCETNQSFRDYLLKGKSAVLKDTSMVAKLLKLHSKMMAEYTASEVEFTYKVLRLQVMSLGVVGVSSPAYLFLDGLQEKEQLVLPIKERGNSNFRDGRYRAAIADYTRAIRISPFSAVLYSNRSLCYLKNGDTWNACVDSFRALVLRPEWEKPYYRCSEAWLSLGNHSLALKMNKLGRDLCSSTSELCRQNEQIMVAMENSKSDEAPPTDPAPPFPPATEKGEKPSAKARKKERKQRERGQRSTLESTANSAKEEVNSGNVAMTTPHFEGVAMEPPSFSDDDYESDFDDITEQLLHEISGRGRREGGKVGPPREPIEDENEWEFHHTRTAKKISTHRRSRQDDSDFSLSSGSEPDEDYLGSVSGLPNPEEEAAMAAQREEREMAEFRKREKERERMREERAAMRAAEENKLKQTLPNPDPYTQFDTLAVPNVDVSISTDKMFQMMEKAPSNRRGSELIGRQYTSHSEGWRSLEPLPPLSPPVIPKPPADKLTATFDEVWCPLLAGVVEAVDIIPPRIHYVGNMVTKYIPQFTSNYHLPGEN